MALVEEPTRANVIAQEFGLLILRRQLLKSIAELNGEGANAAVPLLLRVHGLTCIHTSWVKLLGVVFQVFI